MPIEPMLVRWLIQLRLEEGRLPRGQPTDLRERAGDGQSWCDGCGTIFLTDEKVVVGMVPDDWREFRLHWDCFLIWETERLADNEYRG